MAADPGGAGADAGQDASTSCARAGAPIPVNDYELGATLRRQILGDLERGLPCDGRRLQALVGDLCGNSQLALLPALRYLVMTPAFSSAAGQQPPLPADGRLQLRLQQELDQVFAAAICVRMDAVLRGLLALAPQAAAAAPAPLPAAQLEASEDENEEEEEETALQPAPTSRGSRGVVAVLSFIAGVLVVGVGGGLAWLLLQTSTQTQAPSPSPFPAQQSTPSTAEPEPTSPEAPPAPDLTATAADGAQLAAARSTVEQLYNDLSVGNIAAARQRFGGEAADQFDPAFFRQFQRVSADNLREVSRDGTVITLEGTVTFVYPDGSSQSESRQFTVDTATDPALITASSFGQVLRGRQ